MSDEEDEAPSLGGGLGFSLGRRKLDDEGDNFQKTPKKKMRFSNASTPGPVMNSFAVKMMAKMGYVEGQGLGADGRGRLAPIETSLRPQGVGLGAVKEKTKQAKEEEKREAAFRGEVIENSSDEDKKRRRKRKENRYAAGVSGTSTPGGPRARPKIKYRTATEIELESEGLQIPTVLKSIIDINGRETKLLMDTSGLLASGVQMVRSETASMRIAREARRDLEAFADEWSGLSDRKKYYELQSSQIIGELDSEQEEIRRMKGVIDAIQELHQLTIGCDDGGQNTPAWETMTKRLEAIEVDFRDSIDNFGLHEVAVAAIHPLFRTAMLEWEPLNDPNGVVLYIRRLSFILGVLPTSDSDSLTLLNGYQSKRRNQKSTTHFETLIYTLWLPPVRTAITNMWDPLDPTPLTTLMTTWRPFLPPFILSNLIDQLIVPRLITAISNWKPSYKNNHHQTLPLHIWIFPWLPHLPTHHTDPTHVASLLSHIKQKLRSVLANHPISSGPPAYLTHWFPLLPNVLPQILTRHLLPRLASYLHTHLVIDPSSQDLTPITTILTYNPLFPPSILAALFVAELFPKWHAILHLWLTSDPNYDEIREWFLWWKEQLPPAISTQPLVDAEWTKGLETINHALELGDDAAALLPPPAAGPSRPLHASLPATKADKFKSTTTPSKAPLPEPTFKDVVEDWCAEEGLLLMPLREAHETNGAPLFRITASASGKGGVVVYIKGDVLWARSKKDKSIWGPVGLDEGLVGLAGG